MAINAPDPLSQNPTEQQYFLELFKRDVRERLTKIAMEEIQPIIDAKVAEAVKGATDAMTMRIEAQYQHRLEQVLVHIGINGVPVQVPENWPK